jgi:hypothetical protein
MDCLVYIFGKISETLESRKERGELLGRAIYIVKVGLAPIAPCLNTFGIGDLLLRWRPVAHMAMLDDNLDSHVAMGKILRGFEKCYIW